MTKQDKPKFDPVQVYLTEDQHQWLDQIATERLMRKSAVAREIIRVVKEQSQVSDSGSVKLPWENK